MGILYNVSLECVRACIRARARARARARLCERAYMYMGQSTVRLPGLTHTNIAP